jgi:hypothetical protein
MLEGWRDGSEPSGPKLDDRDLLPMVEPVGLDGHRHVIGVKAHRHVELEIGGDLDAERWRRAEGHEPGRRVDRPARELLYAAQVNLYRACDRLVMVRTSITLPDGSCLTTWNWVSTSSRTPARPSPHRRCCPKAAPRESRSSTLPVSAVNGRPISRIDELTLLKTGGVGRDLEQTIKASKPTDAAAGSGGPPGRARDRLRFHRLGGLHRARLSWPAAPRAQPSTVGNRRGARRRLLPASPRDRCWRPATPRWPGRD